jgi:1,4-dihydroxy-2-naphthoate polyprenyltransferase
VSAAGTTLSTSALRAWVLAARPKTLPAAAVPVLVGTAVAIVETGMARLNWLVFFATLTAALLIQVGTNFANDYSDFFSGADHAGRLGPARVTQSGLLPAHAVRLGTYVVFAAALMVGLYLAWVGGWPIVLIGSVSIVCGFLYTGGPWPFGYHGLGDLFVFVFFGVVAVTGTAYLQTGAWSGTAILASVPVGLLSTNILVVNNLRDLPTDRLAGKHTLAVRIGDRATRIQYALFMIATYTMPLFLAPRLENSAWLLITLFSAPLAVPLARSVLSGASGKALNAMLERTGRLLLAYGVLLAAGMLLAGG